MADFLPGNYVSTLIEGKKVSNVAQIPRNIIDNESRIYFIDNNKLQRANVEILAIQGEKAIIKQSFPSNTELVTTILQKPLVGMKIKSTSKGNSSSAIYDDSSTNSLTLSAN